MKIIALTILFLTSLKAVSVDPVFTVGNCYMSYGSTEKVMSELKSEINEIQMYEEIVLETIYYFDIASSSKENSGGKRYLPEGYGVASLYKQRTACKF